MSQLSGQARRPYLQLFLLILAGGAIYPVLYLRQNFEASILEVFDISLVQLGNCYSLLGIAFMASYLPSGWLADRVPPRWLISGSMLATSLVSLWFATIPSLQGMKVVFVLWGVFTGLTFWGALIKSVSLIAPHERQGTFFGLLEGGRGAVEALLATLALAVFAWLLGPNDSDRTLPLQGVIVFYATALLALTPLVALVINIPTTQPTGGMTTLDQTMIDLKALVSNSRLLLAGLTVLTGYQVFWATYSFSGLLESIFGLGAVAAGTITVAKLWMRPIGAVLAGLISDRLNTVATLGVLMLMSATGLVVLALLPTDTAFFLLVSLILMVGLMTYGVRGIYWATLDDCGVPAHRRGLAIGLVSVIGYLPDIYLPWINAACLRQWPGQAGYLAYYGFIAGGGLLGGFSALYLARRSRLEQVGGVPLDP